MREWDSERTFRDGDYQQVDDIINDYISEWNTLVCCHGGMDRSPFVVALYLHVYGEMPPFEAYELVKRRRPETIIHDDWMNIYIRWAEKEKSYRHRTNGKS